MYYENILHYDAVYYMYMYMYGGLNELCTHVWMLSLAVLQHTVDCVTKSIQSNWSVP